VLTGKKTLKFIESADYLIALLLALSETEKFACSTAAASDISAHIF
jgi:hypothetical protein